jgi:hypothetical protein
MTRYSCYITLLHVKMNHVKYSCCLNEAKYYSLHQWGSTLLTACQSDAIDLAKCHKEFLKRNVNKFGVFKALILCVSTDSTNHLGKGRRSQVARGPTGRVPLPGWLNVFYVILVGCQREDI